MHLYDGGPSIRSSAIEFNRGLPQLAAANLGSSDEDCARRGGEQRDFGHFLSDLAILSQKPQPARLFAD